MLTKNVEILCDSHAQSFSPPPHALNTPPAVPPPPHTAVPPVPLPAILFPHISPAGYMSRIPRFVTSRLYVSHSKRV